MTTLVVKQWRQPVTLCHKAVSLAIDETNGTVGAWCIQTKIIALLSPFVQSLTNDTDRPVWGKLGFWVDIIIEIIIQYTDAGVQ